MATRATVAATFVTLADAEAAMTSLLRTSMHVGDVVLTKGAEEHTYVVTVAADERIREVEDVLRQHVPMRWRTTIHDDQEAVGSVDGRLLHVAPEADRLEQDAPWLAAVSEAVSLWPMQRGPEADWIEQAQAVYPLAVESRGQQAPDVSVPEADYAEQLTIAYRELPQSDEG
jgi:hypothetical protein